jgi:nucleotide-binding universal stress UspA family protein
MKRILVGLDGSPNQEKVLRAAIELAQKLGGKLTLVRAVSIPAELPVAALSVEPTEVGPLLADAARKELEEVARSVPPELFDGLDVTLGTPWRTLVERASADGAELLILGSHGYGGLDRLLGTTAAKVVNHAACSVLVVR